MTREDLPNRVSVIGGGRMGALIREAAWEDTALGPISVWEPALMSALSVILGSPDFQQQ